MRRKLTLWSKFKLWFFTLFYHYSFSYDYCFDTVLEPIFWFIDEFMKCLGPFFVAAVIMLIGIVVGVAHLLGLPFWWSKSPEFTAALVVIGYWILSNVVFHFYQSATVSPGVPNDEKLLAKCSITICKKCINPKPARAHHCSVKKSSFSSQTYWVEEGWTRFFWKVINTASIFNVSCQLQL